MKKQNAIQIGDKVYALEEDHSEVNPCENCDLKHKCPDIQNNRDTLLCHIVFGEASTLTDHFKLQKEEKQDDGAPYGQWLNAACSWLIENALFYQNDTTDAFDEAALVRGFRNYMESVFPITPINPTQKDHCVYISGPISGYDPEERRAFFGRVKDLLKEKGYTVMNPKENGLPADATTQQHMRRDYQMLSQCDAILMLPKWNHSAGCLNEFNMAVSMGCRVAFLDSDFEISTIKTFD